MFCVHCGSELSTKAKFCDNCGKRTDKAEYKPAIKWDLATKQAKDYSAKVSKKFEGFSSKTDRALKGLWKFWVIVVITSTFAVFAAKSYYQTWTESNVVGLIFLVPILLGVPWISYLILRGIIRFFSGSKKNP